MNLILLYTKIKKRHILLFLQLFLLIIIYSSCEKQETVNNESLPSFSLATYEQIDSVAIKTPALALNLLESAYQQKDNDWSPQAAYYHFYKGRINLLQNEGQNLVVSNLNRAIRIADSLKLIELQIKSYRELAIAYSKQRDLQKAMLNLNIAFKLAEKTEYTDISYLYLEAGLIMNELDASNPKSKEYLLMATEKHINKNDSLFFAKINHNRANLFLKENQYDSAYTFVSRAIVVFEKDSNHLLLCKAYNTLGAIYERKGEALNSLKYYKLSAHTGDKAGAKTAFIYANIARHYQYTLKDYDQALAYYLISIDKEGKQKDTYLILENIANIYEQQGNLKNALEYYKKSMALKKADLEKNYQKNVNRLEVEFDLNRKKQTIKEQTLEIQNQGLRVKQQRIFIISLVVLIVLSIVSLLLFIRQKNIKQEYEKVILEQQLLRSQMNPHFIFNAISVIQYLVKNNEGKQADRYLSKFSRLLRKSLENSTEQFTSIQDEVNLLEDYLALQKLRFTNEFDYNFELYKGFEEDDALVPPMIIQPFVENCIEHGIRNINRKGFVKVLLHRKKETLVCQIDDNGRGLYAQKLTNKAKKKSLSTKISKKRLEIIEKKLKIESKIEIIDKKTTSGEDGTLVLLTIPIKNG